jgi:Spy/CpxP family protein refolding chaperone
MPRHTPSTLTRRFRTTVLLSACIVAAAAVAPVASAQGTPGSAGGNTGSNAGSDSSSPRGRGGNPGARMMEALFQGITMTDVQKKSADSIHAAYQWQIAKVNGTTPWIARRDLRQKEMADLRAVLAPAQQPAFDKNLDALRARMMSGGGQRGGGPQ